MSDKTKAKLLVFDQPYYAHPFSDVFDVVFANTKEKFINGLDECDVVLFTGGSDVSPHLYNEPEGTHTTTNPARDKFEQFVWHMATQKGKGKLGICRGLQFAVVMAGGKLVQHTTGHTGSNHLIEDIFGNSLLMNSVHHQMVRPETVKDSVVIAWNKGHASSAYLDGFNKEIYLDKVADKESLKWPEPEIVWLPTQKALGIQGHPEMSENVELHNYCNQLIRYFLLDQKQTQPKYRPAV